MPLPTLPGTPHRRFLLAGGGLALLVGLALLITGLRPKPPTVPFTQAREALTRARHAEAASYAETPMKAAEAAWAAALSAWQHENTRWFLVRDFRQATLEAQTATRSATEAAARADAVRDSLKAVATSSLLFLQEETTHLKRQLDGLPHNKARHEALAKAITLLNSAERALSQRNYRAAARDVQDAATHTAMVNRRVSELLGAYLADLPTWRRWHEETLAWSTRHQAPALIVDKMARRCYVYVGGQLRATYPVELGPRWMGDKWYEGDLATPEGTYRVTRKLGVGETRYHRALLINYPNDHDRQRFAEAKRRGDLPADARIGGLIELHGQGGRGANWTNGCVALNNPDMEALFQLASIGTPITIVGALAWPLLDPEPERAAAATP